MKLSTLLNKIKDVIILDCEGDDFDSFREMQRCYKWSINDLKEYIDDIINEVATDDKTFMDEIDGDIITDEGVTSFKRFMIDLRSILKSEGF